MEESSRLGIFDDGLTRSGLPASETHDERISRGVMTWLSIITFLAGLFWGLLYFYYDEPAAGTIPLSYSALTAANGLALLYAHKRMGPAAFLQLTLVLLLPFALMIALGGFVNSSAVILWSITAPLGALLVFGRRAAVGWFAAYIFLGVIGGVLEGVAPAGNNLPPVVVNSFFVLNISAPILCSFLLLIYFVEEKNRAYELLGVERDKSEKLLLNVLPRAIVDLLKEDDRQIARHFDEVTVLFADLVGFTPLSETMAPRETVAILNEIFSHFDQMVEQYGVEKIRTIGDGYMVAAGVPVAVLDHAAVMAGLALDMVAFIASYDSGNEALQIRIGMNSGEAVAGIVGTTKFHYDLWGDAVNVAARMESHGEAGKIQIARGVYERIKDRYLCVSRGQIMIKGKGPMETWFLERGT